MKSIILFVKLENQLKVGEGIVKFEWMFVDFGILPIPLEASSIRSIYENFNKNIYGINKLTIE